MTPRLTRLLTAMLLGTAMLAPGAARAFTFEDGKGNAVPRFDLEEQARQFRKPDTDSPAAKSWETPIGKLQFGVGPGNSSSVFGSPFSPYGFRQSDKADRRHYERLFVPESMKNLYD